MFLDELSESENGKGPNRNLRFKEDTDFKNRSKPFFFSMIENYETGKDVQLDDYLKNFKIIKLINEGI